MRQVQRRRSFWLKLVIGLAALVGAVALGLVGVSVALWRVKSSDAARAAAVLQASAAALGLLATAALVGITAYYAWVTGEILRRSGPEVHADLHRGWTDFVSGVVTVPLDGRKDEPVEQFTYPLWAATIRNAGGAAVTVDRVGIELYKSTMAFYPTQLLGPTSLPHRLESHSTTVIYFETPPGALERSADFFKVKARMRAKCELGSGEIVVSDWKVIPKDG